MSLLIARIQPERATVAVDTAGLSQTGAGLCEFSKMLPLPHAQMIAAVRGQRLFLTHVVSGLHHGMGPGRFDDLLENFHLNFDLNFDATKVAAAKEGVPMDSCELLMVGWSEIRRRFVGMRGIRQPDWECCQSEERDWLMGPDHESLRPQSLPDTDDDFARIARAQVQFVRDRYAASEVPIGGRLLLADLHPGTMEIREVCRL